MRALELLTQAQVILTARAGGGLSSRMAAFLARQALEEIVDERCSALGVSTSRANMRSKLLILRALDDPSDADLASVAWNGLSNACHLHAYEMQPSIREVEQLCAVVAELVPSVETDYPAAAT